jgi:hypothetical protein
VGVDLNRNYGYHYGQDDFDSSPCSETYRGPSAFSEPETQAVRGLVQRETRISSAMNFHSYGNLWIHPFNYMKTKEGYPDNLDPAIVNFYEAFKAKVGVVSKGTSGNAFATVGYSTDGEGSDWMLGEHNIIAFSPELGSSDNRMNTFYFEKSLIYSAIQENYQVVSSFLDMNTFQVAQISHGLDSQGRLWFNFANPGLAELYDADFVVESEDGVMGEQVAKVEVEVRPGEVVEMAPAIVDRFQWKFGVPKLRKLSSPRVVVTFKDGRFLQSGMALTVTLKLANGMPVTTFPITVGHAFKINRVIIGMAVLYALVFLGGSLLVTRKIWEKRQPPTA